MTRSGPAGAVTGNGAAVPDGARLDLRLLVPALVGWALDVGLLWVGAPAGVTMAVAAGCALGALGCALAAGGARASARSPLARSPHARSPLTRSPLARSPLARSPLARVGPSAALPWVSSPALGLCLAVSALLTLCLAGHDIDRSVGSVGELAAAHASVELEAVVAGDPRPVRPMPGRRVDSARVVVPLQVRVITGRGQRCIVDAPVLAVADGSWLGLQWGQQILVRGRLAPAEAGADVIAVLRPIGEPISLADPPVLLHAAAVVRARVRDATAGLPPDPAGLVPALVLGDTSVTPPDLTAAMTAAGLSHLSAVSGSNVAIVLGSSLWLARVLGVRRRWRPVCAVVVLAAFVVLVRPQPSVLRAAVMGGVGLLGLSTSRRALGPPSLAAAIVGLLCWDPWLARSYGFALSVLATLGLLVFARPWGTAISRRLPARLFWLGPALAVPIAAQAMCAPVGVLMQGSVSLVAVPANLAAAVFVAPATLAGVLVALLACAWVPLAQPVAWAAGLPAWAIAGVARVAADQPWGSLPWPSGPAGAALLAVLVGAAVALGPALGRMARRRPAVAATVLVLTVTAAYPVRDPTWPPVGWRLVACAVGQGDGIVLATEPGHAVLVDTGPDPRVLGSCLDRLGVQVLDAVILTHFHADHVQGLAGALRGRVVREVLTSPVAEPPDQVDQVLAWTAAAGVPVAPLYAGDLLAWPGVQARVWWPARVIREGSVPNNASVVITAALSGSVAQTGAEASLRVALLGDIERGAARAVLSALREQGLAGAPVDVVKVAHHGSANRDDQLLDALPAPLAIICVGAGNDYGHPAPSTLQALQRRGIRVLRTDLDGDIAIAAAADAVLVGTTGAR